MNCSASEKYLKAKKQSNAAYLPLPLHSTNLCNYRVLACTQPAVQLAERDNGRAVRHGPAARSGRLPGRGAAAAAEPDAPSGRGGVGARGRDARLRPSRFMAEQLVKRVYQNPSGV